MNGENLVSMIGGLAAVLLVLWVLVQVLRRVPALQGLMPARAGKVHASLAVGPRERVVLVEMGGEWMLLGVAPGRVSFLKSLDPESASRWLRASDFPGKVRSDAD